ncbi:hypothetical protein [Rhizobium hidalgonense]|uniref:Uncharacterized protein n=1 Tax=Rhizobium hidalgonense TaxID=1538159 RepID=A0ABX4JH66_9HYPH|nr:hypothetical protein [Rhizobium hidalgonense]PDT19387.1 hypothetical protein CO674_33215 [Rhizobium hidalgonense]PON04970.1 hypothetical protein ATY29_24100 [Rhizobium hidalgonense]
MFKHAEWPETCYIQEVAYWLSFGRIPEVLMNVEESIDENRDVDRRKDSDARFNGAVWEFDTGYTELEFRSLGIEVDYERYLQAPGGDYTDQVGRWEQILAERISDGDQDEVRYVQGKIADLKRETAEWEWRRSVEDQTSTAVDNARAYLFQALSSGQLTAIGWRQYEEGSRNEIHEDKDDVPDEGEFVTIEKSKWSLRNFNWEESTLKHGRDTMKAVQVYTGDVLRLFPEPICKPVLVEMVKIFPGVALFANENTGEKAIRAEGRSPGRPLKGDGAIKSVVQNYFGERIRKGDVPAKREALIQEVADFVKTAFREDIKRSTIQRYLMQIDDAATSKKPNNIAQNSA